MTNKLSPSVMHGKFSNVFEIICPTLWFYVERSGMQRHASSRNLTTVINFTKKIITQDTKINTQSNISESSSVSTVQCYLHALLQLYQAKNDIVQAWLHIERVHFYRQNTIWQLI